jgi:hypothetical protein
MTGENCKEISMSTTTINKSSSSDDDDKNNKMKPSWDR